MTTPIEQGIASRPPSQAEFSDFYARELFPLIQKLRNLANEHTSILGAPGGSGYEWDMDRYGVAFLEPTATFEVSVSGEVDVDALRPGRTYILHVYNNTGGNIDVTFSADFKANGATIPDGTTASWQFVVADPNSGLTEKLLEFA